MPYRIPHYYRYAVEKGHCTVPFSMLDVDGNKVKPKSLVYSLTDESGAIIDGIDKVSLSVLADDMLIVLEGDNLQILPAEAGAQFVWRHLTVEGIIDSSIGNNKPINDVLIFPLYNAVAIA